MTDSVLKELLDSGETTDPNAIVRTLASAFGMPFVQMEQFIAFNIIGGRLAHLSTNLTDYSRRPAVQKWWWVAGEGIPAVTEFKPVFTSV